MPQSVYLWQRSLTQNILAGIGKIRKWDKKGKKKGLEKHKIINNKNFITKEEIDDIGKNNEIYKIT